MMGQDRWRRSETWTREVESCPSTAMPMTIPALSPAKRYARERKGKQSFSRTPILMTIGDSWFWHPL